ncbi:MAG: hypothetical protein SGPRY_001733 [Prymnesium sp.]
MRVCLLDLGLEMQPPLPPLRISCELGSISLGASTIRGTLDESGLVDVSEQLEFPMPPGSELFCALQEAIESDCLDDLELFFVLLAAEPARDEDEIGVASLNLSDCLSSSVEEEGVTLEILDASHCIIGALSLTLSVPREVKNLMSLRPASPPTSIGGVADDIAMSLTVGQLHLSHEMPARAVEMLRRSGVFFSMELAACEPPDGTVESQKVALSRAAARFDTKLRLHLPSASSARAALLSALAEEEPGDRLDLVVVLLAEGDCEAEELGFAFINLADLLASSVELCEQTLPLFNEAGAHVGQVMVSTECLPCLRILQSASTKTASEKNDATMRATAVSPDVFPVFAAEASAVAIPRWQNGDAVGLTRNTAALLRARTSTALTRCRHVSLEASSLVQRAVSASAVDSVSSVQAGVDGSRGKRQPRPGAFTAARIPRPRVTVQQKRASSISPETAIPQSLNPPPLGSREERDSKSVNEDAQASPTKRDVLQQRAHCPSLSRLPAVASGGPCEWLVMACPVCRALVTAPARRCFLEMSCPICLSSCESAYVLTCGHALCRADLAALHLPVETPQSPRNRKWRALFQADMLKHALFVMVFCFVWLDPGGPTELGYRFARSISGSGAELCAAPCFGVQESSGHTCNTDCDCDGARVCSFFGFCVGIAAECGTAENLHSGEWRQWSLRSTVPYPPLLAEGSHTARFTHQLMSTPFTRIYSGSASRHTRGSNPQATSAPDDHMWRSQSSAPFSLGYMTNLTLQVRLGRVHGEFRASLRLRGPPGYFARIRISYAGQSLEGQFAQPLWPLGPSTADSWRSGQINELQEQGDDMLQDLPVPADSDLVVCARAKRVSRRPCEHLALTLELLEAHYVFPVGHDTDAYSSGERPSIRILGPPGVHVRYTLRVGRTKQAFQPSDIRLPLDQIMALGVALLRLQHASFSSARGCSIRACEPLFISSSSNKRLKLMKKLHSRQQRDKLGLMLLEGHRLVLDALEAGATPELVLLAEGALGVGSEGERLRHVLDLLPEGTVAYAPHAVVAHLSDTQTPQGVLAMVEQPRTQLPPQPDLVLVCDRVSDPGNLGTLMRSAAGAGVCAVLLTPGCSDPWGLKALRAGMGAQIRLPVRKVASWEEASQRLQSWGCRVHGADACGQLAYWDTDWRLPSALVIGSEAHGLSAECRADSHTELCSIPMASDLESLNAAVAGSIVLYEAQRQRRSSVSP